MMFYRPTNSIVQRGTERLSGDQSRRRSHHIRHQSAASLRPAAGSRLPLKPTAIARTHKQRISIDHASHGGVDLS